jgi:outer membrane receptor for Fe3+-dicitrate
MLNINKNASNSSNSVVDESLFTDLSAEEASVVEGGANFYLGNKSGIGVNYTLNGQNQYLAAGAEVKYSFSNAPSVVFDRTIGAGYEPTVVKLGGERNNFDRRGNDLLLTTSVVANLAG